MTLVLPPQHKWLSGLRGSSLLVEYLLDKEFGSDIGTTPAKQDMIAAKRIIKAQKIIEKMREKKQAEKDEQRKKPDK